MVQKNQKNKTRDLYIEQHILNESKTKWKNIVMAWIDNKKAFDMVL